MNFLDFLNTYTKPEPNITPIALAYFYGKRLLIDFYYDCIAAPSTSRLYTKYNISWNKDLSKWEQK